MLVVADEKIPFLKGVLEPFGEVRYLPGDSIGPADVRDADVLLTRTRTICDASLLAASKVKLVATATIGFDHIDTAWCESNGIAWINAPGCNADAVCQYVVCALLELSNRTGEPLAGKTIGVVGIGNVGARVVRAAKVLGMRPLLCDPPRARAEGKKAFVSLQQLRDESDVISFHVPLQKEGRDPTYRMANASFINGMRSGAWLLNTSRGPVVDGASLSQALQAGSLGAAVLDVFESEPEIDTTLHSLLAIATPHIAGYSTDGKANATAQVVQAVARTFGIDSLLKWKPESLPLPERPLLELPSQQLSLTESLRLCTHHSYPILRDDKALRTNSFAFENLRNQYPIRREFPAFAIRLSSQAASETLRFQLRGLGFSLMDSEGNSLAPKSA